MPELTPPGTGRVGSAFLRRLNNVKSSNISYNVVMIAKSDKSLVSKDFSPIPLSTWEKDLSASRSAMSSTGDIAAFLERSKQPVILVDNTASESLAHSYPLLLGQGVSIVTPNKKPFSADIGLWNNIAGATKRLKGGLVYFSPSISADPPIVNTLYDIVKAGNKIVKVEGVVSSTLSYIFNEFSRIGGSTAKFSDLVLETRELGFGASETREDLNGMDTAQKFAILSRLCGYKMNNPNHARIRTLVPKPIRGVETTEEFLEKLPAYDESLEKLRAEAEAENKILRYVGTLDMTEKPFVKVGIEK